MKRPEFLITIGELTGSRPVLPIRLEATPGMTVEQLINSIYFEQRCELDQQGIEIGCTNLHSA